MMDRLDRLSMDDVVAPAIVYIAGGQVKEDVRVTFDFLQSRKQIIYSGRVDVKMEKEQRREQSAVAPSHHQPCETPPMPPDNDWPPGVVWLTPNEEKIWAVVVTDRWMTSNEISEKTGIPNDKELGFILRHLTERRFLESAAGRGYRRRQS